MTTLAGKTVVLFGATGAVGSQVLLSLLSDPNVAAIHALGRTSPLPLLPLDLPRLLVSKLHFHLIDFDLLCVGSPFEMAKVQSLDADAVIITLGTSRKLAGGYEAWVRIDREFVVEAARAARIEGRTQTLIYCSSIGADSESYFPYLQSKGLTEKSLASIGYTTTVVFRPAALSVPGGRTTNPRRLEWLSRRVTGILAYLSDSIQIETPVLGAAMARIAVEGVPAGGEGVSKENLDGHEVWSLNNSQALRLGAAP